MQNKSILSPSLNTMDGKMASIPPLELDGEAPPAYSATLSTPSQQKIDSKAGPETNYSKKIRSQLQSFTDTLNVAKEQRGFIEKAKETHALSLISNAVESFLLSFSETGLRSGSLILIPNEAAMPNAQPVYADYEGTLVYRSLIRLECENMDESMATTLAASIRPAPELPERIEPEADKPAKNKRSWWKRKTGYVSEPASRVEPVVEKEDQVTVDIIAKEVVFRSENEFGILETNKCWGIVVNIAIQATNSQ